MAKDVIMPALSPSMLEGTLVKWLKKEGDEIKSGDVLAEVETDKATMDLEAFDSGVLRKIFHPPGSKVSVNTRIAVLGGRDEKINFDAVPVVATATEAPSATKLEPAAASIPASVAPAASVPNLNGSRVKASPLAKKVAKEMGVQVGLLTGTGPGGRVVKRDVLGARGGSGGGWGIYPQGPIAKDERIVLSNMRQTIARRLLESKTQIPHFYLEMEVDAAPLVQLRGMLNKSFEKLPQPIKLSPNDFILKAVAEAIRRVPAINASYEGDAIRQYSSVQLAFAVALQNGLITPVIRDAQNKNLKQIAEEVKTLAARAREGKLKPEEYTTGTFAVSNLGMYGVDRFSAIINPPQSAILAVGAVVKKPVVNEDDEIVVGHRMSLTLSCDHRVVDGSIGALFLKEVKELIENPSLLLF